MELRWDERKIPITKWMGGMPESGLVLQYLAITGWKDVLLNGAPVIVGKLAELKKE